MYYVYFLKSVRDGKLYIGCTNDLQKRIEKHNKGHVPATAQRYPMKLIFYECFNNKQDAFLREKWFKTGYGRTHIKKMLNHTLESLGG